VIDDFRGESLEVAKLNPWLGYGRALHLVREMGIKNRVLDMLDERPLTKGEYKKVCSIIFGDGAMFRAPDPSTNWTAFLAHVEALMNDDLKQWVSGLRNQLFHWPCSNMLDGRCRSSLVLNQLCFYRTLSPKNFNLGLTSVPPP
jgi:hypothetical protein